MPTRRRRLLTVFALLIAAGLTVRYWLNSGPLRISVLSAIEKYYAGHVEIDRVTVGRAGMTICGLRLHDSSDPHSRVIFEIAEVELAGTVSDLWHGEFHPTAATVRQPVVRVFQSPDGSWEFRPPVRRTERDETDAVIPIEVCDATVEFARPGKSATRAIRHCNLTVESADSPGELLVRGRVADSAWGNWSIEGAVAVGSSQLRATVRCPNLRLGADLTQWFQSQSDELAVEFDGTVAADVTVNCTLDGEAAPRYVALIDPQDVRVRLPLAPEPVHNLTGRVEITQDAIRVHGLSGECAGGQVILAGEVARTGSRGVDFSLELRHLGLPAVFSTESVPQEFAAIADSAETLSGRFHARGLRDPTTWSGEFDGLVQLRDGAALESLPLHLGISEGHLELADFQRRWGGGRVAVNARIPLDPTGKLTGTARIEQLELEPLAKQIGESTETVQGTLSGELSFRVPLRAARDYQAWEWGGPLRVRQLTVTSLTFDSLDCTAQCRDGRLNLVDASAVLWGRPISGQLSIGLQPPHYMSARFSAKPIDLAELVGQRPHGDGKLLRGNLRLSGNLTGQLSDQPIKLAGEGSVERFSIAAIDVGQASFRFESSDDGIRVHGIEVPLFGGRLRSSGQWLASRTEPTALRTNRPATRVPAPELKIAGSFDDLELSRVLESLGVESLDIQGSVSGEFQVQIDPSAADPLASAYATARVTSNRLVLAGLPVEGGSADIEFIDSTLKASALAGTIPAGPITGTASLELNSGHRQIDANLRSTRFNLARLGPVNSPHQPTISGTAAGQIALRLDLESGEITGDGSGKVQSLTFGQFPPVDSVMVPRWEIRHGQLRFPDFQATGWGGAATGLCEVDLRENADWSTRVQLARVDHVDLSRIAVAWPALAGVVRGRASGSGTVTIPSDDFSRALSGSGDFTLESASFAGLPLGPTSGSIQAFDSATHEVFDGKVQRSRATTATRRSEQRCFVKLRESHPARGTMQGTVLVVLSRVATYETSLRFSGADLATVLQSITVNRPDVAGTLSGEVRLTGSERGASDARGEMWFRVDNGNLYRLPVLAVIMREPGRAVSRLLNLNGGEQTAQTAVARRVTLENGGMRFHEFWIVGDVGRLFGDGEVMLDGRIDLNVVGNFETGLTRGVPIVGQITDIFNKMQQQLVKFHVTGTLSDPISTPVPLQGLTEPAERFFRGVLSGTLLDQPDRSLRPMSR